MTLFTQIQEWPRKPSSQYVSNIALPKYEGCQTKLERKETNPICFLIQLSTYQTKLFSAPYKTKGRPMIKLKQQVIKSIIPVQDPSPIIMKLMRNTKG